MIVAEDITSRFLTVIGLFNGFIPLVAIQLRAIRLGDTVSLVFTKVMDEIRLGLVDEDEEVRARLTDRTGRSAAPNRRWRWRTRCSAGCASLDPDLELKYNKFYICLAKDGRSNTYVVFRPQKVGCCWRSVWKGPTRRRRNSMPRA